MQRSLMRYQLWLFYVAFLAIAYVFGSREGLLNTQSEYANAKYLLFFIFVLFLSFSLYATSRENFFKSIGKINGLLWGKQVGLDLYISVFLSLALIYMVEGSVIVLLLWVVPVLVFANLAILPFILFNFGEIVGHFPL